uniref:Uncharacterized protein n=1 Tax=Aegilops tauschii TaxID=37682 RepID=M8BYS2_AEGTA
MARLVKSSHAIGELWHNLIKFFLGEEWHYSEHVNYQTHPMTEVRKYYRVPDLATGQGVDHLDAYSEFRREQVLDRQDTHEEQRLLDAVKRVSVQHADLGWTSKFPRSYRWCFEHVTPSREYTDHVMMTALAEALEVPLRVEQLNGGPAHDIYTGPGPGVPLVSVTLLYTGIHYDVLYPRAAPAESSSQQTSQRKHPAD